MNRTAACLVSFVLVSALHAQQPAPAKEQTAAAKEEPERALQPLERYNNPKASVLKAGKAAPAHITIRDWEIHGRQKIDKFPETGTLIVNLHSGRVITTIDGKEQKREPGDYWTVSAGTSMGVRVTSESATLHVVTIGKP